MATIVSTLQTLFTGALDMAGDVVSTIMASGNELLLAFTIVPLIGLGVGVVTRLIHSRG